MKRYTTIVLALVTAGSLAAGATAYAKRGGDHGERMVSRATERLELDTNQQEALRALHDEMMETRDLMRGEAGEFKSGLSELIAAESFDQAAALALIDGRIAALEANAPELVAAAGLFIDGLDATQREELQGFVEKAGRRHGRHHGEQSEQ